MAEITWLELGIPLHVYEISTWSTGNCYGNRGGNSVVALTRTWKKSGYRGITSTTHCTNVSLGGRFGATRQ